jgi:uncharacterized radical SAM superfamily Fe-S cluster-containing enzyme
VCPSCLARVDAHRVRVDDDVYLRKTCPDHGTFQTIVWRGRYPDFEGWARPKLPAYPDRPSTPVDRGCPFDCGMCPDHRQQTCTALLEVTGRCDLRCAFCFADAGVCPSDDPSLAVVESWFRALLDSNGPCNVQLSGGEPTMRDDLAAVVELGRSMGFEFIQLNTNGLRLAKDPDYVRGLARSGLSSVFLQFDGTDDEIQQSMRGRRLLDRKRAAIAACADNDLGVVLVPTLVPGINTDDIGGIIDFALEHFPAVKGVHFQPVSYFGRYPEAPTDDRRFTIPDVIRAIGEQTGGRVTPESITTSGCENALCSLHGNFVVMPDGALRPWTKHQSGACCAPTSAAEGAEKTRGFVADHWSAGGAFIPLSSIGDARMGDWDVFLARKETHTFTISGMAFQDAWNLDLDRLRECCIHTVSPDGRIIPFCAYNLTDRFGRAMYRRP